MANTILNPSRVPISDPLNAARLYQKNRFLQACRIERENNRKKVAECFLKAKSLNLLEPTMTLKEYRLALDGQFKGTDFPSQVIHLHRALKKKDLTAAQTIAPCHKGVGPEDLAVGFGNLSNNCWVNSLFSMMLPHFREIYETVATHHAELARGSPTKKHGITLQKALNAYDTSLREKRAVPPEITQAVRVAFHHLFHTLSPLEEEQEDPHEALGLIMGEYQKILNEKNQPLSPLYSEVQLCRHYEAVGNTKKATPSKEYSTLDNNNTSLTTCKDFEILLDLQDKKSYFFPDLLKDAFCNSDISNSEIAEYQLKNGKVQNFKLIRETRQFLHVPQEFLLSLKRFGVNNEGIVYKITRPVRINRMITLPPEATTENKQIAYALDSFILHIGHSIDRGHYICYKKIRNHWVELDDEQVRFVKEEEIDQILHGEKDPSHTSYMHHYSKVADIYQNEATCLAATQQAAPIANDRNTRRRIQAELAEVKAELDRYHPEEPIIACLLNWHDHFVHFLRHPNIDQVIHHFIPLLEDIFKDPLNPEVPFHPKLFSKDALEIVQFMIGMMRKPNLLLYSKQLDQAAPKPITIRTLSDFDEQLLHINKIQKLREEKNKGAMQRLQNLNNRVTLEEVKQNQTFADLEQKLKSDLSGFGKKITEEDAKGRVEEKQLKKTIKPLEKKQDKLGKVSKKHNKKLKTTKESTRELEASNTDLQNTINKVRQTTHTKKQNWLRTTGLTALSMSVSWVTGVPILITEQNNGYTVTT